LYGSTWTPVRYHVIQCLWTRRYPALTSDIAYDLPDVALMRRLNRLEDPIQLEYEAIIYLLECRIYEFPRGACRGARGSRCRVVRLEIILIFHFRSRMTWCYGTGLFAARKTPISRLLGGRISTLFGIFPNPSSVYFIFFLQFAAINYLHTCFSLVGRLPRNATDVAFSLRYNVMPYVGVLTTGEAARSTGVAVFPEAIRA
jgi:hypothetical protein